MTGFLSEVGDRHKICDHLSHGFLRVVWQTQACPISGPAISLCFFMRVASVWFNPVVERNVAVSCPAFLFEASGAMGNVRQEAEQVAPIAAALSVTDTSVQGRVTSSPERGFL